MNAAMLATRSREAWAIVDCPSSATNSAPCRNSSRGDCRVPLRLLRSGLHVTRAGAVVPLGLAGDGLHSLVHTVLELAAARDGVVLLEEPESYQHPMSLYQTAFSIVAGVRRGLQIVLSTHSVELIDALLCHLGDAEAWRAAPFTLELRDGELRASRLAGAERLEAQLVRRHGVR